MPHANTDATKIFMGALPGLLVLTSWLYRPVVGKVGGGAEGHRPGDAARQGRVDRFEDWPVVDIGANARAHRFEPQPVPLPQVHRHRRGAETGDGIVVDL